MIWNEPNNKSHWDPAIDPDWSMYADHVIRAGNAIHAVNPQVTRVLGGMSPIDPLWINRMRGHGALDAVDLSVQPGDTVPFLFDPRRAHVFDQASGQRL